MRFNPERKNKFVDRMINSATDKTETMTSASLNGRLKILQSYDANKLAPIYTKILHKKLKY